MMGVQRLIEAAGEKKVAATGAGLIQIYGGADRLILESLDARLSDSVPPGSNCFFAGATCCFPIPISVSRSRRKG